MLTIQTIIFGCICDQFWIPVNKTQTTKVENTQCNKCVCVRTRISVIILRTLDSTLQTMAHLFPMYRTREHLPHMGIAKGTIALN